LSATAPAVERLAETDVSEEEPRTKPHEAVIEEFLAPGG
jgi:hypothetical protein